MIGVVHAWYSFYALPPICGVTKSKPIVNFSRVKTDMRAAACDAERVAKELAHGICHHNNSSLPAHNVYFFLITVLPLDPNGNRPRYCCFNSDCISCERYSSCYYIMNKSMMPSPCTRILLLAFVTLLAISSMTQAFSMPETGAKQATSLKSNNNEGEKQGGDFFKDLKGMFSSFDDVVDDFVYKRMGAGEQWYGKRKYNPSGKVEGDYNGMGQSDHFRIELARVQKEEMEKRRQRRLAEEEEARKNRT